MLSFLCAGCTSASHHSGSSGSRTFDPDDPDNGYFSFLETLIFIEWDDVLLPTTWLRSEGLINEQNHIENEPNARQVAELRRMRSAVEELLTLATERGRVAILNAGPDDWVDVSSSWFYPNLQYLLARVYKVYNTDFNNVPGIRQVDAFETKTQAVGSAIYAHFFTVDTSVASRLNMLSLEVDPAFALDAAAKGLRDLPYVQSKTLSFLRSPTGAQLLDQLENLLPVFKRYIGYSFSWRGDEHIMRHPPGHREDGRDPILDDFCSGLRGTPHHL